MRTIATAVLTAVAVLFGAAAADAKPMLGVGDIRPDAAVLAAGSELGARYSRVIVNPNVPLWQYDDQVAAVQAAGMVPHIHLTTLRAEGDRTLASRPTLVAGVARAAVRRWHPRMVTAINEPDIVGVQVCQLAVVQRYVYKAVKRVDPSVLVPFGEFGPRSPITMVEKLKACGTHRVIADGFSTHPYDFGLREQVAGWEGTPAKVGVLRRYLKRRSTRAVLATSRGGALPIYWTEAGAPVEEGTQRRAAAWWTNTLRLADRNGVKVVTLYHMSWDGRTNSNWQNTAILGPDGGHAAVFQAIARTR